MTEFKITGPGLYKTRAGEKVEVTHIEESFTYAARCGEGNKEHRTINGAYYEGQKNGKDIIGPWEEPATVSSVLTYAGVTKKPSAPVTWLEFVQIMQQLDSTASTLEGSPNGENRSEDEAEGNEACDEAGDALKALRLALLNNFIENPGYNDSKGVLKELEKQGFSIVRTSTMGNRNGCYNTRTDKDVD